jgi:hypothetical protein
MASRVNFPNRIEARRTSAKLRQEASNKLSLDQRLAKATPGSREYNKLLAKRQTQK